MQTIDPINSTHLDRMFEFFKQVLQEKNIDTNLIIIFINTLNEFRSGICSGDSTFNTLE